jgi:hypothetical protein
MTNVEDLPHPLHDAEFLDGFYKAYGNCSIGARRTGRSTAEALRVLAWCIEHPYEPLHVSDHFGSTASNQHLLSLAHIIAMKLDLKELYFNRGNCTVTFGDVTKARAQGEDVVLRQIKRLTDKYVSDLEALTGKK